MNMMSNQFPHPQPELVQYPLPILRTEGLFFFLNDSHFCICSSPPSPFLLLSSLLTLPLLPARPLQACCCSLLQRRAAWRHWRLERSLDWSRRGRKMGRRLGGEWDRTFLLLFPTSLCLPITFVSACVCVHALSLHCCRSALPVQRILCNVGSPGPARSQCCRENTGENRVHARLSPPRCARLLSRASVWIKLDSGPRLVCICVRACRGVRGCEITFGGAARPHPLDRLLVVDPCAVQNVRIKDRQRRMIQWLLSRRWRLSGDSYMQLFRDRSETLAGLGL